MYAEALLGREGVVDLLLGKKQSAKNKILAFFSIRKHNGGVTQVIRKPLTNNCLKAIFLTTF